MSMLLLRFKLGNRRAVVIAPNYEEAVDLLNDMGDDWRDAEAEVVCSVYPQLKPHVLAME